MIGASLVISTTLTVMGERSRALQEAGRELKNLSVLLADHTDRAFQSVSILQNILIDRLRGEGVDSADTLRALGSSRQVHTMLQQQTKGLSQVEAVSLIDDKGNLVNISRSWPVPELSLADRDYFMKLRDGAETVISEPIRARLTGAWTMHIGKRVSASDGTFLGAVVGVVELSYFHKLFGDVSLGPETSINLLRSDGMVLARFPEPAGSVGRSIATSHPFRALTAAPSGTPLVLKSVVDNEERMFVAHPMAQFPLRIHVGSSMGAILSDWRRAAIGHGISTALLLVLLAAATMAFRRTNAVEEAAAEQDAQFRVAVQGMSQGLWMFGPDGRLTLANGRCCEVVGYPAESLAPGSSFGDLTRVVAHTEDVSSLFGRLDALVSTKRSASFVHDLANGRAVSVVYRPISDGAWVATFEDVTERRKAEARVVHMAHHDALTGLPNRVLFQQRLQEAMLGSHLGEGLTALLYIDLDNFKLVNDTLGHPVGDLLLQAVTSRLTSSVREGKGDTFARLGGDEFAIILRSVGQSRDEAVRVATLISERLIEALSAPFDIAGQTIVVGASVGAVIYPGDGETAADLLRNADLALYRVKQEGRGRCRFFEPLMDARMQARRLNEIDLRRALSEPDAPEIEVHYQPVVRVATREVSGFEALVRWRHPERGLVSPADFIPLAEEVGLVVSLGEIVLQRACTDAATWPSHLSVAVNISPAQFRSPHLVERILGALEASDLQPNRLELEITEGVLLQNTDATLATLHELRLAGLRIAMDDFGTGYSSLSYLRSFPFDKLKIDRAFVRDLATRQDDAAIVQAVTTLCETLNISTTAEGVETEEQFHLLARERCTEVQGFLFSPAVPAAEVPGLLDRLNKTSKLGHRADRGGDLKPSSKIVCAADENYCTTAKEPDDPCAPAPAHGDATPVLELTEAGAGPVPSSALRWIS